MLVTMFGERITSIYAINVCWALSARGQRYRDKQDVPALPQLTHEWGREGRPRSHDKQACPSPLSGAGIQWLSSDSVHIFFYKFPKDVCPLSSPHITCSPKLDSSSLASPFLDHLCHGAYFLFVGDTEVIIQIADQIGFSFAVFQGVHHSLLYTSSLLLSFTLPCRPLKVFEVEPLPSQYPFIFQIYFQLK